MRIRAIVFGAVLTLVSTIAFADSVHMTNGSTLNGKVVAMDLGSVSLIKTGGEFESLPVARIGSIAFNNSGAAAGTMMTKVETGSDDPAAAVPAGKVLTVSLSDKITPELSQPGNTFGAVLTKPVVVDGRTVAPAGSKVKVGIVRVVGTPHQRALQLTEITIGSHPFDVVSGFGQTVAQVRLNIPANVNDAAAVAKAALRQDSLVTTQVKGGEVGFQVVVGPKLAVTPKTELQFTLAVPIGLSPDNLLASNSH